MGNPVLSNGKNGGLGQYQHHTCNVFSAFMPLYLPRYFFVCCPERVCMYSGFISYTQSLFRAR